MRRFLAFLRRRRGSLALACCVLLGTVGWWTWRRLPLRHLHRGEEALSERRYDRAREELNLYLAQRPNDARARLLAARAARRQREYFEAYEHLRHYRELAGDDESAALETMLLEVQRGGDPPDTLRRRAEADDDLALEILEVLIQYDLDFYRLRSALHSLTRYLQRRPDDLQARLARAFVWERFLYFNDALEDYRAAAASHPDSVPARLKLAQTLLLAGTPAESLEQFERLAEKQPEHPEVLLGLGRCRRRLGEQEPARLLLTRALAAAPRNPEILCERGLVELDAGNAPAAEPWLRQAVQAGPHDRRFAAALSRCLLAQGRKKEAAVVDARVAALDADLRRLEQVRQAVMENPRDPALRCEGGLLFLRNGERAEGLRWLRLALKLDPQYSPAREALDAAERSLSADHMAP